MATAPLIEEDFLRQLIASRVQRNPQLRQTLQLATGEGPQPLTGLTRSRDPLPVPVGPKPPSLTPSAPPGPAAGRTEMSGPMRGGRVSSATGNANAAAFDRGLQRAGLGPAQRAAALGSAQTESSFNPNAWNARENAGGMIQWRANRLNALRQFAASKGERGMGSAETQGEFFGLEAQGKVRHLGSDESRGSRAFLAATDPVSASQALKSNIRWGIEGGRHSHSRAWGAKLPGATSSPPAPTPPSAAGPGPRAEAPLLPPGGGRDGRVQVASTDPNFVPAPPERPSAFRNEQVAFNAPGVSPPRAVPTTREPPLPGTGGTSSIPIVQPPAVPPRTSSPAEAGVVPGPPGSGPSITAPLGPASAAPGGGGGITIATTPATPSTPATVTKVDPATGGLRTYVVKGKDPGIVDRLNPQFSRALQTMIEAAPPEIREHLRIGSGYRDPEHQKRLFDEAVRKYGSEGAARKWVAPPGRSQHGHGQAVDLSYGSPEARQWAQANAGNYGLRFPMAHEPWHIEAAGARDPNTKVLPPEAGGPALGQPTPSPSVTQMPPAASAMPGTDFTPQAPTPDTGSGLGGLLAGLASSLGSAGGSGGGNLNVERHISPGMGPGYDEKIGAASKSALGAQPLFGNIGDLAKLKAAGKMFDLQSLGEIGQPQMKRRNLGFGLG